MADDPRPTDTSFEPRRAQGPVGGAREAGAPGGANLPRRAGEGVPATARPPRREPERLLPKPLQRAIGFVILFSTVGLLSCQAFWD